MPKLITELAQANTFSLTAENGRGAYSATRAWKVILLEPNESYNVEEVTGVSIGSPYRDDLPIPCVSLEARADGDSRVVRVVTATYRATPGTDPNVDPKTLAPTSRPASYSMTTSLQEVTAWGGKPVLNGVSQAWVPSVNPVGDLYDGVVRLEPVVTVQIELLSLTDRSDSLAYTGFVNSDVFTFSLLTVGVHCCMLQSLTSNPVVEQFGENTFRGFKVVYNFGIRRHDTITRNGYGPIGWDIAIPQTGFNIINSGLGQSEVDQQALALEHQNGIVRLSAGGSPLSLVNSGQKMRASVTIPATDRAGFLQRPSAQPVALNDDGTPRNTQTQNPRVLINRVCMQPEMAFGTNFSNFGIPWIV